ncbi:2,3-bisphosphoglycerate-independent phosphoglycerate mutase, partial [TM7 phylum sp. oral taxon 351]
MQAKSKKNYTGPVVLVVMDGVGIRQEIEGNAVSLAYTEFLHQLEQNYPKLALQASGEAVGILAGQMGNSEVGHNALGSGQIIKQGIAKINQAFSTGEIWQSSAWQGAIENLKIHQSTLHFSGIFSDGGVHSELSHLFTMLRRAAESGIKTMRIHAVFDGRDVAPQSAEKYL